MALCSSLRLFFKIAIALSFAVLARRVVATSAEVDSDGYVVKTVLDGNPLGLSVYDLQEDANGAPSVIVLDSTRSSISRVLLPISQSSVVKRISGSRDETRGYRDGTASEALFYNPRKLTLDTDGNIYVADPKNFAVRMISTTGVVSTIAGGSNRTGHDDGEGGEVTFSNDFEVTYLHRTCTLAVADRGNRMVREIQLPHFVGRCRGIAPNSPAFTVATLLMFLLVGVVGVLAGATGTILSVSTSQLERLQSRLGLATTEGSSSSIWKRRKTTEASPTLQMKEASKTRFSGTRNAAAEGLVWAPAFVMEVVVTLFERFLYVLLYSLSLLLRLLCSLLSKAASNNEADLLGLHNQPRISSSWSVTFWRLVEGLLVTRRPCFQMKESQLASLQVQDFSILGDLIDFSEPLGSEVKPTESAPASVDSSPADDGRNGLKMDSMVAKCLTELAASSPQPT